MKRQEGVLIEVGPGQVRDEYRDDYDAGRGQCIRLFTLMLFAT